MYKNIEIDHIFTIVSSEFYQSLPLELQIFGAKGPELNQFNISFKEGFS
jgi:hypothetical protein